MTTIRFKLDDFDSEVEMWELMNTQAEIISDLEKENEQLKSENNMLKHTIGRNEAYIKKLTETSEWHC